MSDAYTTFFGDPPDAHHAWAVHDQNRPQPPRVDPAEMPGAPPSDAIVLFDGTQESFETNWFHTKPEGERESDWSVVDGAMVCAPKGGYIATKEKFGDCQLHIEWSAPSDIKGKGQGRGNSGVFLMGMVEVQVLDNYENPTYADGTAGAVYGVMPPAANALRPPGEWQSYDIIFRRPIVRDGEVLDPGSLTVMCNGVVIQDSTPINGGGGYKKRKPLDRVFPDVGSLSLQDHGNPVRFRNIWYRPLRPREFDGGSDGRLSTEAALAKRAEIAAGIREDAAQKQGLDKALRLLEAQVYMSKDETQEEADAIVGAYLEEYSTLNEEEKKGRKWKILSLYKAYNFLVEFDMLPPEHDHSKAINVIVEEQGWDPKKK
ncbi:MAG: DUF1080 domain-containing protein [Verrucomicrobiota bacterium]